MSKKKKSSAKKKGGSKAKSLQSQRPEAKTIFGFGKGIDPPASEFNTMKSLVAKGRIESAIKLLEELAEGYPESLPVHGNLFALCAEVGELRKAFSAIDRAIEIAPDKPVLKLTRAQALGRQGSICMAARDFREVIEQYPDSSEADEARETLEAWEKVFQEILELEKTEESMQDKLAHLEQIELSHYYRTLMDWDRAIGHADRAIAIFPDIDSGYLAKAEVYWLSAKVDKIFEVFESAIDRISASPTFFEKYALVEFLVGDRDRAAELRERLMAMSTGDDLDEYQNLLLFQTQIRVATLFSDSDSALDIYERARPTFETMQSDERRAKMLASNVAEIVQLAGVAADRLGDRDRARELWKQAMEWDDPMELAYDNLADSNNPDGDRHGPCPFSDFDLFPGNTRQRLRVGLLQILAQLLIEYDGVYPQEELFLGMRDDIRRFQKEGAEEIFNLMPYLETLCIRALPHFDSDTTSRIFQLIEMSGRPAMLTAVADWCRSGRGSHDLRFGGFWTLQRHKAVPPDLAEDPLAIATKKALEEEEEELMEGKGDPAVETATVDVASETVTETDEATEEGDRSEESALDSEAQAETSEADSQA